MGEEKSKILMKIIRTILTGEEKEQTSRSYHLQKKTLSPI